MPTDVLVSFKHMDSITISSQKKGRRELSGLVQEYFTERKRFSYLRNFLRE